MSSVNIPFFFIISAPCGQSAGILTDKEFVDVGRKPVFGLFKERERELNQYKYARRCTIIFILLQFFAANYNL